LPTFDFQGHIFKVKGKLGADYKKTWLSPRLSVSPKRAAHAVSRYQE